MSFSQSLQGAWLGAWLGAWPGGVRTCPAKPTCAPLSGALAASRAGLRGRVHSAQAACAGG